MAIIVGNINSKDLPENDRIAIGITLPIQRGNSGYFTQSYKTEDQIRSNLKNLILTRRGERLMHPTFGTNLYNILFENITDQIETQIEQEIEAAIAEWMQYISINEIVINRNETNRDKNIFSVDMSFFIEGQQNLQTIQFNIEE